MNEDLRTVIVTSDEPWSDVWHTQLQYANQLAKRFRVIFLGPPVPWKINNLFRFSHHEKKIEKNLNVIRYINFLPAFFGNFALTVNDRINEFLIRKRFLNSGSVKNLIVWHFDRYRSIRIFDNPGIRHIYHVIDPVANLNGDVELSRKADLIIVTSPRFVNHYIALSNNVIQLGQGFDTSPASGNATPDEKYKDAIVLLGTITDSIDSSLLKEIVRKFSNPLLLIGPDKIDHKERKEAFQELLSMPGVMWPGAMPPAEFYKYLRYCKAGLIAYDLTGFGSNTLRSPLKVINYLAAGKIVISNIDCEIPELEGKAIYVVKDRNEYIQKLRLAIDGNLVFDAVAVKTFLDSISYERLLEKIFSRLNEVLPGKEGYDKKLESTL